MRLMLNRVTGCGLQVKKRNKIQNYEKLQRFGGVSDVIQFGDKGASNDFDTSKI